MWAAGRLAAALALLPLLGAAPAAAPRLPAILIASDSTAADAKPDRYPQMGWGTMLRCAVAPGVEVRNHAFAGRSTRTFLGEGRWDRLMAEVRPGDTVLIQFGHNDADRSKPERFTRAWTDYRDNLLHFVWMVRGAQAVPVLITPVARHAFNDRGLAQADFAEYSDVVREVAEKTATPLIDLESLSRAWLDKAGPQASLVFYLHMTAAQAPNYPQGIDDNTHLSELGARAVADLVATALAGLTLPVSKTILPVRPDLTRTSPLGRGACH
ncbi:rhamnogalacturonan acetylesterase [Sphingomonas sp. BIUV-7]|uniref:Rhamnogalacturonan acetylesterase n=1 Tax=Sphingomonas natans TaxID=3063330 RepID=A0ABT8Y3G4_9SPHN|nr:rhamnogalacturonan acetylesterase [Sphingomonas sp. BIUV-7]MDO6412854.1 rhamnogalacturonan acetylesterase [Sphingomonas sp. BIUV-7]